VFCLYIAHVPHHYYHDYFMDPNTYTLAIQAEYLRQFLTEQLRSEMMGEEEGEEEAITRRGFFVRGFSQSLDFIDMTRVTQDLLVLKLSPEPHLSAMALYRVVYNVAYIRYLELEGVNSQHARWMQAIQIISQKAISKVHQWAHDQCKALPTLQDRLYVIRCCGVCFDIDPPSPLEHSAIALLVNEARDEMRLRRLYITLDVLQYAAHRQCVPAIEKVSPDLLKCLLELVDQQPTSAIDRLRHVSPLYHWVLSFLPDEDQTSAMMAPRTPLQLVRHLQLLPHLHNKEETRATLDRCEQCLWRLTPKLESEHALAVMMATLPRRREPPPLSVLPPDVLATITRRLMLID
jgi:hypothetical protein